MHNPQLWHNHLQLTSPAINRLIDFAALRYQHNVMVPTCSDVGDIHNLSFMYFVYYGWLHGAVVERTSVFDRRAFPVLRSTCSGRVTT